MVVNAHYLLPAAAFCCTLALSASMICVTPEGSSTTFVPSHFALFVNSVHSSLMSMSCNHVRDPLPSLVNRGTYFELGI